MLGFALDISHPQYVTAYNLQYLTNIMIDKIILSCVF